ncbi:sensor histidine kinase [Humibacter ginsenosidimutans]|nr:sensor histidine kinase [Humibacter ginsenosidimutans]
MQKRLWWDAAVAVSVLACAFLVWLDTAFDHAMPKNALGALLALAAFAVAYGVFGRWLIGRPHPVASQVYLGVVVVITAVGCAADPNIAVLQAIAYPLIGCFAPVGFFGMLAWDVLLALGVFVGLAAGPAGATAAAITAVLSFLFAVAIGLWILRITHWGLERARLLSEVQKAQQQAAVSARDAGAARERERLARDMHDTVAQSLTGLVMLAERAQRQASAPTGAGELPDTLATIEDAARETLREIRSLVAETTTPSVDDGLAEAARRVVQRFARETGIAASIEFDAVVPQREHEVVLLRCLQEGLANVRKHARAATAAATLRSVGDTVVLEVVDDGVGVAGVVDDEEGFGLAGMRERVRMFGGTVALRPAPGGGARLTVSVPSGSGAAAVDPSVADIVEHAVDDEASVRTAHEGGAA